MMQFWSLGDNCTLKAGILAEIKCLNIVSSFRYLPQTTILLICGTLCLQLWIGHRTKRKMRRKTANGRDTIPRISWFPVKIPLIDGLYTPFKLRNDGVKVFEELSRKYGSIYEMPFGKISAIIVSDATVIKKVLTSSNANHLNKPRYIYDKIFENILRTGLLVEDHQSWSFHRSIANRAFSYKNFQSYLKIMNTRAKLIVKGVQGKYSTDDNDEELDIRKITETIDFQVLATITEACCGARRYSDETNYDTQRNIHRAKEITLYRLMHPELFIEWLWKLHPKKWELDGLWRELTHSLKQVIDACKLEIQSSSLINSPVSSLKFSICPATCTHGTGNSGSSNDRDKKSSRNMIEEMIHSRMSDNEIYAEIASFLIAGFETTITALNTLMFHLARNQEIQKKCREEVDSLLVSSRLYSESDADFDYDLTMEDLSDLKYMERCILENFRLTSTVPTFARRLDTCLKVDDYLELPAGQVIVLVPWVIHRENKYFPNPIEFDPDRFLPENVKSRDSFAFIPFSGGLRNCIGKKFAMMEIKVVLTWILRHFEIFTTDELSNIKFFAEASLRPEHAINMTLKRRSMK